MRVESIDRSGQFRNGAREREKERKEKEKGTSFKRVDSLIDHRDLYSYIYIFIAF